MPNRDVAHEQTEKILQALERRIAQVYAEARDGVKQTLEKYWAGLVERDRYMRALVKKGEITQDYYTQWLQNQIGRGERYEALQSQLAERVTNAAETAYAYINDATPSVYSLNRNYGAYTIERVAGSVGFTIWDESTVRRLLVNQPELMPYYPPKKALKRGIDLEWGKKQIRAAIQSGILRGESIGEIANDLQRRIPDMSRKSALRAARTAMTGAQNGGRMDSYKAASDMGIKVRKRWVATKDSRTRDAHQKLDGKTVDWDESFTSELGKILFPGDPRAKPANVYNCFVGDVKVASDSKLIRSYKHIYEGDLITVKTAGGVQFTCTPNHPILTPNGWVSAELLNNGDNILVTFGEQNVFGGVNPDIKHRFPRIDAIHNLFNVSGGERAVGVSVDFHGDVATSNVEIVTQERLLWNVGDSSGRNGIDKFLLKFSNKTLSCSGSLFKHFWSICKTSFGFIGCKCKSLPFFKCSVSHSCEHGCGTIADRDRILAEYSINDLPADTVIDGELLDRLSCKVFLDTIVNVDVSVLSTHVYNLQTENGYYFVNSIIPQNGEKCNGIFAIAKNCRCTLRTVEKEGIEAEPRKMRVRDPKTGRNVVVEEMTYEQWERWVKSRA